MGIGGGMVGGGLAPSTFLTPGTARIVLATVDSFSLPMDGWMDGFHWENKSPQKSSDIH